MNAIDDRALDPAHADDPAGAQAQLARAAAKTKARAQRQRHRTAPLPPLDYPLLLTVLGLLGLGCAMVASAAMPIGAQPPYQDPLYFVQRHFFALGLALLAGGVCFALPSAFWERAGLWLLLGSLLLLALILVPGIGYTVNGATRWIRLGPLNLQVSETVKLFAVLYVSGYLVRHGLEVSTTLTGFVRPLFWVGSASLLIVAQPDFGTTAVLLATVLGLLFLGGVPLIHFIVLFGLVVAGLIGLILIEPYRLARVTSFLDPFADPFASGYQLSQALIAFGRGEWLGVGLGNGIQKQYFLPEAHTDFLLATIGEELGLLGVLTVIGAFAFVTWRAFAIGARARQAGAEFAAYVAHGIGLLLGLQAFVNAGVNTGLLPTKGLTLPFMSYGSNALIAAVMAIAILLRIDWESRRHNAGTQDSGPLFHHEPQTWRLGARASRPLSRGGMRHDRG